MWVLIILSYGWSAQPAAVAGFETQALCEAVSTDLMKADHGIHAHCYQQTERPPDRVRQDSNCDIAQPYCACTKNGQPHVCW